MTRGETFIQLSKLVLGAIGLTVLILILFKL